MFQSWAANIIKSKFEDPIPSEDLKDHFMRGEWEVLFIQKKNFLVLRGILMIITSNDLPDISLSHKISCWAWPKLPKIGSSSSENNLFFANDDHYQVIMELIEKHPEFKAGKVWKISYITFSEKRLENTI